MEEGAGYDNAKVRIRTEPRSKEGAESTKGAARIRPEPGVQPNGLKKAQNQLKAQNWSRTQPE